jgi:hypothetical protein
VDHVSTGGNQLSAISHQKTAWQVRVLLIADG